MVRLAMRVKAAVQFSVVADRAVALTARSNL
jgi:hypothetical protein